MADRIAGMFLRRDFLRKCVLSLALAAAGGGLSSCTTSVPDDMQHRVFVSIPQQRLGVYDNGVLMTTFAISTSKYGLGDRPNSNFTPLGKLRIAQKIGAGSPLGMKFKDRKATGEIVYPNTPGRDPIVTRILWLQGLEPQNAQAYSRYIYIHGTPEEFALGTPRSYGCVRMASRDIVWLYDVLGLGARVDIVTTALPQSGQLPP